MRKIYLLMVIALVSALVLSACGGSGDSGDSEAAAGGDEAAADEGSAEDQTLKFWSWNEEMKTMAIAFEGENPDVEFEYTSIPMSSGEYQTKLLASLGTADAPDIVALEAAFVKEYVESDFLADLSELMPVAEAAQTYPFVTDVGTDDGVTKAYSFQATPGALFYRRSLAKEYFGTDDPAEIQELLSDMDKYAEAAAVVKEKSGGDTYMVASSGDFADLFYANREQPWIVDDKLVVDPMVNKMVETAKLFHDEGYEAQATQWQEGWFAGMNDSLADAAGNPKQVFSYFLPTWGLPFVLAPNAAASDGSSDTSGDWAVINGPLPYQWGGTWLGVLEDSPNKELAKQFVEFATLDEENLTNWATGVYTNEYLKAIDPEISDAQMQPPGDFVSSKVVVEKIVDSFDDSELSAFLAGQNSYAGFAAAAPAVSAELLTGSDWAIKNALTSPLDRYLNGDITEEEMWQEWHDALRIEFPDLVIE